MHVEQYPTIRFLLRFGDAFAVGVALAPIAFGIGAALYGWHWSVLLAGAVASVVLGVLMKSYIELVRVIADMLIPK